MNCKYPKCRNVATVQVRVFMGRDVSDYQLCDDCLDALRVALRNQGIEPDEEPDGLEIVPCQSL